MAPIIDLPDPDATQAFGRRLARLLAPGLVIYLSGPLGAGKTSLCGAIIGALGHCGPVKSPTYTLVEPYLLTFGNVYHFDLYRLADPEELEWIGARDYFDGGSLCLIEWPERGSGALPPPDLTLQLTPANGGRRLLAGAGSARGRELLARLTGGD
ncbi:MAG: tRNA (adenosine(37)-N6)-threonylcarbamoyltransferase complex ATPase subunit type 1 TsaE [Pseudomonadota bacterium]